MTKTADRPIQRIILTALALFISVLAARGVLARYQEFLANGSLVASFLAITLILAGGFLFTFVLIWKPYWLTPFNRLKRISPLRQTFGLICCILPMLLYTFHRWSEPYGDTWIRIYLYGLGILLSAWCLSKNEKVKSGALINASLIFSLAFLFTSQFRFVTGYPFSNGWSEGNRFWDYSVLFGRQLYNWPQDQPIPAYIDLGRQSLWGAIFLLPNVSIGLMRFWNAFLFTIPYILLGWALLRARSAETRLRLAAALWALLFLSQGPIYTPLVLAAALVAFGRKMPFWLACALTALAGAYAVMSRSTWILGPAVFAALLILLEKRGSSPANIRLRNAILIGVCGLLGAILFLKQDMIRGVFGGAGIQQPAATHEAPLLTSIDPEEVAPGMFSPEGIQYFLTRQPLLWSRLFPNETYRPGILLGLLLAAAPLLILMIAWLRSGKPPSMTVIEWILSLLALAGFLAMGIVVSVKIGGGSNLHNLDLFLIALLTAAAICWNDGMGVWLAEQVQRGHWLSWIVLAAVLIPISAQALQIYPKEYPTPEKTEDALQQIQQIVEKHREDEVLFIDQRQLLTFNNVARVKLIADYEKKWMMDEAMADNAAWFKPYHEDLKRQRFAVIISEPLQIKFQGANLNFSEENDLFVKWVSLPTLCAYEPLETFAENGVQILVPRTAPLDLPNVECP